VFVASSVVNTATGGRDAVALSSHNYNCPDCSVRDKPDFVKLDDEGKSASG
jgi:hypothetical protein